jgi:Putative zinc-finger
MRAELTCSEARTEFSAHIDGELSPEADRAVEAHLAVCEPCSILEEGIRSVARAVRMGVVDRVPDLAGAVVARLEREELPLRRAENRTRLRIAAVAAAAAALLLMTTSLPWEGPRTQVARAGEVAHAVASAAAGLERYRATFAITERGWQPGVPVRRFSAEVAYRAPEEFAVRVRDLTTYRRDAPWPRNSFELVANGRRSWIREPTSCPGGARPECPPSPAMEERSIIRRGPFDGAGALPTDIVVPLETLAGSADFEVLGAGAVLGRAALRVALPYREAIPLVEALQAGGSWRAFHPLDRVEIWLDRSTWFPLAYRVTAGASPDRPLWSEREGLGGEDPGQTLLDVRATGLELRPDAKPSPFDAPTAPITTDAGFREASFERIAQRVPVPRVTGGLHPYRAARSRSGARVLAYSGGMAWLKVTWDAAGAATAVASAEEVRLQPGGWAYYRPAGDQPRRRVDLYTRRGHVAVESNLGRGALLEVARSLDMRGHRAPLVVQRSGGGTTTRIPSAAGLRRLSFADSPAYLPSGARFSVGLLTRSPTQRALSAYYRNTHAEYADLGIRITQATGIDALPPSADRGVFTLRLRGVRARWTPARGELEWMERGVYRAVAVPSFDVRTAVRIAESLT